MISYYLNLDRGVMYMANVAIYGNTYLIGNFDSDESAYAKLSEVYEAICNTNDEILERLNGKGHNKKEFIDWSVTNDNVRLPHLVSHQIKLNNQLV